MSQDRATFQQLAEERLNEAQLLLTSGRPSGAYYLAGYAVECALKARIAAKFRESEIPSLSFLQRVYTHDLVKLLSLAGLDDELDADMKTNANLEACWTIVSDWTEQSRYEIWTIEAAKTIVDAVEVDGKGMLPWLRNRW